MKDKISDTHSTNNIIIFEHTDKLYNNCEALLSINNSELSIKRVIIKKDRAYIQSMSHELPLREINSNNTKIFGIIVEARVNNPEILSNVFE